MKRGVTKAGPFWRALVICLFGAFVCTPASALDPNWQISQYAHTAWRVQDGVFSGFPRTRRPQMAIYGSVRKSGSSASMAFDLFPGLRREASISPTQPSRSIISGPADLT